MMKVSKLSSLHGVARIRKCAVLLEKAEMNLVRVLPSEEICAHPDFAYACELARFLTKDSETTEDVRQAADTFLAAAASAAAAADRAAAGLPPGFLPDNDRSRALREALRPLNEFRHFLMQVSGQAPADWDLHDYCGGPVGESAPAAFAFSPGQGRHCYPGLRVYLEDIRSPFNVGTIFRTAEAFGFEEVLLSPQCADPDHPRARRSSMGAIGMIPWRRCTLDDAASQGALFALELGGTNIHDFDFPSAGIIILGSEELGVSRLALSLATLGPVSIPMRGNKASINVAVAFGIAASLWTESISH